MKRLRTSEWGLLAALLAAAVFLATFDWRSGVSTDVGDLLPSQQESPEARLMLGLIKDHQSEVALVAVRPEPEADREAVAAGLVRVLQAQPAFAEVTLNGAESMEAAGRHLYEQRYRLLLPAWLAARHVAWTEEGAKGEFSAWLAEKVVSELEPTLSRPDAFFLSELAPNDPLLLLAPLQRLQAEFGDGEQDWIVAWARLKGSALDENVQAATELGLAEARAALHAEFPIVSWRDTGVFRIAAASREAIKGEVQRLNIWSMAAVFVCAAVWLRRPWRLIRLVPMVLAGFGAALVAVLLIFPHVHVLALVLGAFLAGITIDFGFHATLHAREGDDAAFRRALLGAALSTLSGFAALLFSSLPVLQQLGVFVVAGVMGAAGAALILRERWAPRGEAIRPGLAQAATTRPWVAWTVVGGLVAFNLWAVTRVRWADDIRELNMANPVLSAADEEVRSIATGPAGGRVYFSTGDNYAEAVAEGRRIMVRGVGTEEVLSLARLLPLPSEVTETRIFLRTEGRGFLRQLRLTLADQGWEPEAFRGFYHDWEAAVGAADDDSGWEANGQIEGLVAKLPIATSFLLPRTADLRAVATVVPVEAEVDLSATRHSMPVSQLETLNAVFGRYRVEVARLAAVALGVVSLLVFFVVGRKAAGPVLLVPWLAAGTALSVMAMLSSSLNLFHLVAAMLGFCLAVDYGIFAWKGSKEAGGVPASVRLAALTTLATFGVLATSGIPAVGALGGTVAVAVTVAWILVEVQRAAAQSRRGGHE